jgi:hypothetical protein
MMLTDTLRVSDDVVAREVGGEVMLLDLVSGTYFGLDAVGGEFWNLLTEGKTPQQARDLLLGEYDVSAEDLDRDLQDLLDQLAANGLIHPAGG